MKKSFPLLLFYFLGVCAFGQTSLYSARFNTLALQSASGITYTSVPSQYILMNNDGQGNNPGYFTNPNAPFGLAGMGNTGWAVLYNALENDTFLVSTSWMDTTGVAADRWIITPPVSNLGPNSVLTWLAKSPDSSFPEGYEVYGTTNTVSTTFNSSDFPIGNRLFAIADGNTAGSGEKSIWTRRSVPLSGFQGAPTALRLAFRDNSKDMFQLWLDDIEVINTQYHTDAALTSINTKKYVLVGALNSIAVNFQNTGAANINTLTLKYTINNSTPNAETFTLSTPLAYGQSGTIPFSIQYSMPSAGLYKVKCWVEDVNGALDESQVNDTAFYYVTIQSSTPNKTVLVEQFVSAKNGASPDAQEKTNGLPAIVVNVHDEDSLKDPGSVALINDYRTQYATALIDRRYYSDLGSTTVTRNDYADKVTASQNELSPVSVSIENRSFNPATRVLTFTVSANFAGTVRGNYRLDAYLTENQVCGPYVDPTPNGFNQANDYYAVSWSPYYQKGYYFPSLNTYFLDAIQFKHQNVLLHAFDGAYGTAGVVPTNSATGTYTTSFTYTVPTSSNANAHVYNPDNLYIVGFVAEYSADKNQRTVLNAVKAKVNGNTEVVSIAEQAQLLQGAVYPNPSTGMIYFSFDTQATNYSLNVLDVLGHCVKTESGVMLRSVDLSGLPQGVYFVKVNAEQGSFTQKIVIQKN